MRLAYRLAVAIVSASIVFAAPAAAKPVYFYKAGIDRQTYVGQYTACEALAGGVRVNTIAPYSSNIYATAAGALFAGFFRSGERRALVDNILRTCMADKGFRRVVAPDHVRKELAKLDDSVRIDRLFDLATAATPQGEVLPR